MTLSQKLANGYRLTRANGVSALMARIVRSYTDVARFYFVRYYQEFDRAVYDPKLVWVDPRAIRYTSDVFPFPVRGEHAIVGVGTGDWDRCRSDFEETALFDAVRERYVNGREWEETEYYEECVRRVHRGEKPWNGCESVADIDARCARIDEIYDDMRSNGYRTQNELAVRHDGSTDRFTRRIHTHIVPDEIRLAIGRNGELIRCASGKHRVILAKILDIERIPAVVQIEHRESRTRVEEEYESIDPPYLYGHVNDHASTVPNEIIDQ